MKYHIALVQPNFQQGPKELNAYYLPYSAGVLWSYAKTSPKVSSRFECIDIIWKRLDIESTAQRLKHVNVCGFSTYVWNRNYNYKLAQRIKELNPDCLVIFGGPEPSVTDHDIFMKHSYIDIVIMSEGEITLRRLLESYPSRSWQDIPGLLINFDGRSQATGPGQRVNDLDGLPSPYLDGTFDKIIADNSDIEWNGTLETNRGCPYACTFCDWGSLTYNKVKKFGLQRVFDELDWMAKNRIGFISITDANFGMFPDRDNLIADKLIAVQKKHGYPKTFSVAWAKNQKKEVVDIVHKLIQSSAINQGLTLSVQSLDIDVLENIKRQNMGINRLGEIFSLCERRGVPTYTELILGLPGERLDTWKKNFWQLFDLGNHTGLTIFQAQLLENAEMNLLQKKLYGIKSRPVTDYFSGSYSNQEIEESIDIVTATRDLPQDAMLDAAVFSWYINTFHINGLSTLISRFLKKYQGVEYQDFYDSLWQELDRDPWLRTEAKETRDYYSNWMIDGKIQHPNLGGIEIHGWNLMHRTVLNIHVQNRYQNVFGFLKNFLSKFDLPYELMSDIMTLQTAYFVPYQEINQYPKNIQLNHNLWEYITDQEPLLRELDCYDYCIDFPEDKKMTFTRFLELFYFARRRNFGKAAIKRMG